MDAVQYFQEQIEELYDEAKHFKNLIEEKRKQVTPENGLALALIMKGHEKVITECYEKIGFYRQAINSLQLNYKTA